MSAVPAGAARPRPASILSPIVDLLCVGGLSILVIVPLLLSGRSDLGFVSIGALAWAQALINYSHFMASYRIIYRDRAMILRHKWASIGVPLILLGLMAIALAAASTTGVLLRLFFAVASAYLAWHYTGQVWGMMASHAFLDGTGFDRGERLIIRGSLRILLSWHVVWFLNFWLAGETFAPLASLAPWAATAYEGITWATAIAFLLGAFGLLRMGFRTRRVPPLRAIVPWVAIFCWYAAIWRWGLPAFFLVQLAHAIQYLEFPARVELNRATRDAAGRALGRVALYAVALLAASFLVILAVPGPAMSVLADFLGVAPQKVAPALVLYFINIHHYFTDGVAWKISNPEVRRELFAHVAAPIPARPGAGTLEAERSRRKAKR